jgi:Rrf2 family protein
MKLSTRSRYGARILVDLARHNDHGPVQIGEISKRQDISVKYLEQLIRPLKQASMVTSVRGPKGGHVLAKNPKNITLGQIVRLFEGQTELVECISNPEQCNMSDDCQVRLAWKEATRVLYEKLDSTTISDLMQEGANDKE